MKQPRFIKLDYRKTIKKFEFRLFKLYFEIRIKKDKPYSTGRRVNLVKRGIKSGFIGELHGVKFFTSSKNETK